MALIDNFSGGTKGADYVPNQYSEFNNMIGKVAYQVIRSVQAKDPMEVFHKMAINKGDTIEQAVVKLVEANGYDFEGTNTLKRDKAEKLAVRYFQNWERRVYKTTIDLSIIRKILLDGTGVEDTASKLVATLGQSDKRDRFKLTKNLLKWGTTNASGEGQAAPVLKKLADVTLGQDGGTDYKAILKQLKDTISGMKYLNSDFNTAGIERLTLDDDIYVVMPYKLKNSMDVDELSAVFNLEKDKIGAHIIETDAPDKIIYVLDRNAVQIYTRLFEMRNQENAEGLFWNHYLHDDQLYALSPLFDGCFFNYDVALGKKA